MTLLFVQFWLWVKRKSCIEWPSWWQWSKDDDGENVNNDYGEDDDSDDVVDGEMKMKNITVVMILEKSKEDQPNTKCQTSTQIGKMFSS